jgi:hypothetical protein
VNQFKRIYEKWNLLENIKKMRPTATFYNQGFESYPFLEKSNLESEFANQDPNPVTSSFYSHENNAQTNK